MAVKAGVNISSAVPRSISVGPFRFTWRGAAAASGMDNFASIKLTIACAT